MLLLLLACSDYAVNGSVKQPAGDTGTCPDPGAFRADRDDTCLVIPPEGGFSPTVEWQWNTGAAGYDDIMSTPVVGNLNDDNGDGAINEEDIPDVVFSSFAGGAYTIAGAVTAISGDGGAEHWSILDAGGFHPHGSAGTAIGDLDGDGVPEVCVAGADVSVICLNHDGTFRWAAGDTLYGYAFPGLADLNGDGSVEVLFGNQVFDANGGLLWAGGGGAGHYASFGADVDSDGIQEVIAGNTIYNQDGSIRATLPSNDGFAAVADFDGDGVPEVVTIASTTVTLSGVDGSLRWATAIPDGRGGGPPTIADFDGDGLPEVGVAGSTYYSVYDTDGTVLWSNTVQDYSSSVTGSSVFDFEGDGKADVVYADEVTLWVYDGATGAVKLQEDGHASGTLYEYPLVVDVDHDGASEIVLASNNYTFDGWNGITVIGDANNSWRPSRPIWNQFAYSITNVNDDGSIPRHPENNWTRFNNFRTGGTLLGLSSELPNLQVGEPTICCIAGEATLYLQVSNVGLAVTTEFDVGIYQDGTRIAGETLSLNPGEGRSVGPYTLARDDWSGTMTVRVDRDAQIEECHEDDNHRDLGDWPCP